MFIRTKKVKGKVYRYEVENYRCPDTGKVKQRTLKYLGAAPTPPDEPKKLGTTKLQPGDRVTVTLSLYGEPCQVSAVIVPGTTNSQACRYPREGRIKYELLTVPYQPPGTVTVAWRHGDASGVSQVPIEKVQTS